MNKKDNIVGTKLLKLALVFLLELTVIVSLVFFTLPKTKEIALAEQIRTIDIGTSQSGDGYSFANNMIEINESGAYLLTGSTDANQITVASGLNVQLSIENIECVGNEPSISIDDSSVAINLIGQSQISGLIALPDSIVNISGTGILISSTTHFDKTALGFSSYGYTNAIITINGGTIIAESNGQGTAIGGSESTGGGHIVINGGIVTARGLGFFGVGIGAGRGGNAWTDVTINGGEIEAYGGWLAAGIGSPKDNSNRASTVHIAGGRVRAYGGEAAAGIGACDETGNVNIEISGGIVEAFAGAGAIAIGTGEFNSYATVQIDGGTIKADSIGATGALTDAIVTINGGNVSANYIYPDPKNGNNESVYLNVLSMSGILAKNVKIAQAGINGILADTLANPQENIYGINDVYTNSNGSVNFYLPTSLASTPEPIWLVANGQAYTNIYERLASASSAMLYPIKISLSSVNLENLEVGKSVENAKLILTLGSSATTAEVAQFAAVLVSDGFEIIGLPLGLSAEAPIGPASQGMTNLKASAVGDTVIEIPLSGSPSSATDTANIHILVKSQSLYGKLPNITTNTINLIVVDPNASTGSKNSSNNETNNGNNNALGQNEVSAMDYASTGDASIRSVSTILMVLLALLILIIAGRKLRITKKIFILLACCKIL